MKKIYKKGLTMAEVLVVIAVLGIIFAVILPQFAKNRENQVLKNAVGEVISSLDKARSQTLASLNANICSTCGNYGVHFQSDKVIIFRGTVFSANDANNETINIITPANISNISLGTGISDVYFARLTGAPSHVGTITVSTTSFLKTIRISATGVASVN